MRFLGRGYDGGSLRVSLGQRATLAASLLREQASDGTHCQGPHVPDVTGFPHTRRAQRQSEGSERSEHPERYTASTTPIGVVIFLDLRACALRTTVRGTPFRQSSTGNPHERSRSAGPTGP